MAGPSGFLGRHILKELLEKDYIIRVGVWKEIGKEKLNFINKVIIDNPNRVFIHFLDILEKESWMKFLNETECVIYCISIWTPWENENHSEDIFIEIEGFLTLLNACKELSIKWMILPGSLSNCMNGKYRAVYTDSHWADSSYCDKAEQAKLLIEKCAWNF